MEQLLSYKGDKTIKASLIKRMESHIKADELLQGATGQDGKGCTVWRALNNGDISYGYSHSKFPSVLGLPEWLAQLQDKIFEGLSTNEAKKFSIAWLKAIPVGKDLEKVKHKFALWVLRDGKYNVRQHIAKDDSDRLKSFDKVCEPLERELAGDAPSQKEWRDAYAYASAPAEEYYLASSKELLKLLRAA